MVDGGCTYKWWPIWAAVGLASCNAGGWVSYLLLCRWGPENEHGHMPPEPHGSAEARQEAEPPGRVPTRSHSSELQGGREGGVPAATYYILYCVVNGLNMFVHSAHKTAGLWNKKEKCSSYGGCAECAGSPAESPCWGPCPTAWSHLWSGRRWEWIHNRKQPRRSATKEQLLNMFSNKSNIIHINQVLRFNLIVEPHSDDNNIAIIR